HRFPNTRLTFVGGTMSRLASMISLSQDGPGPSATPDGLLVINQTGIPDTETFDFVMEYGADPDSLAQRQRNAPAQSTDPLGPTIFEALGKLGLTLERGKGPREFIVIDQIERPSSN